MPPPSTSKPPNPINPTSFWSQPEKGEEEEDPEAEAEAEAEPEAEAAEGAEGGEEEVEPVELPPVPEHYNLLIAHKMLAARLISEEEYLALKEIVRTVALYLLFIICYLLHVYAVLCVFATMI